MTTIKGGGPAFPHDDRAQYNERAGMTLRDYFAAKAMQGLLANQAIVDAITNGAIAYAAVGSYAIADAMLAAREGKS